MTALTSALCSVHTHSALCDGSASLREMAAAAYGTGVRYFGASGHSHTPAPDDRGLVLPADMAAYRAGVLELRQEYAGRMEVLLGIELDACADVTPEGFDYWIGSVHDLLDPETGRYYFVDWDEAALARCCVEMFRGSFPALIGGYYQSVAAIAAQKPTILGHLDLITKFNGGGGIFDEDDPRYRAAALAALHAADPDATLLEINTSAVVRGYRAAPYPAQFLLREWRRMGGQVILTSDAHTPEHIVSGYELAAEWAGRAGFTEAALLTSAGRVSCPL